MEQKPIEEALLQTLKEEGLHPLSLKCIATIPLKSDEPGIIGTAANLNVPLQIIPTEEIEKLKTTADNLKDSTCKAEQLANEMVECAEIKELTTAIVNRLIEKIEVSEPQTIDGEKVQNIRIFYKFVGEIN